jgi:hypothetical protein
MLAVVLGDRPGGFSVQGRADLFDNPWIICQYLEQGLTNCLNGRQGNAGGEISLKELEVTFLVYDPDQNLGTSGS